MRPARLTRAVVLVLAPHAVVRVPEPVPGRRVRAEAPPRDDRHVGRGASAAGQAVRAEHCPVVRRQEVEGVGHLGSQVGRREACGRLMKLADLRYGLGHCDDS